MREKDKKNQTKIKLFDEKIISISSIDYKVDPLRSLLINLKKYCEKNEIVSKKQSGKVKKEEMPSELLSKCSIIIHAASTAAGGVGAVQIAVGWIPVVGNAINTATAAGLTEAIGWLTAYQFYQDSLAGVDKKSLIKEKCE